MSMQCNSYFFGLHSNSNDCKCFNSPANHYWSTAAFEMRFQHWQSVYNIGTTLGVHNTTRNVIKVHDT